MYASCQEVVLQNGLTKEVIALLRTISAEPLDGTHLMGGLVHRLDDSRSQRLRHVANAERDDVGLGVHDLEGVHLLGDVGEQVVLLQVQEMNVY